LFIRHKARHEQQPQNSCLEGTDSITSPVSQVAIDTPTDTTVPVASSRPRGFTLPSGVHIIDSNVPSQQADDVNSTELMINSNDSDQLPDALSRSFAPQRTSPLPSHDTSQRFLTIGPQNDLSAANLDDVQSSASPSSLDEFAAWLFEGQKAVQGQPYFIDLGIDAEYRPENFQMTYTDPMPIFSDTTLYNQANAQGTLLAKETASEERTSNGNSISREKWNQLLSLITGKLLDTATEIDEMPHGNFDDEQNPLSLPSMHVYLESYWKSFHDYLPILHQPTFAPATAHLYLLMAVLILGSSMLDRQPRYAGGGMKSTNLMAWNLRGHILLHIDASSPCRLWVFQALLLLEIHDKLLASTALHERALVYFPTTLNLMRQSSTLFGRQVPKSPSSRLVSGNRSGGTERELSVGFFAPQRTSTSSPESWWEYWIVQEAIRRAAFAAFVLDITHSVMFGHSQTLVFHEIHMYLPVDRLLWSSNSPGEIGAVESSLYASGIKPPSFLDALRKMFNGQPCRTNSFGWLVLLAGLLSIIGHMQQRDLLASSLKFDLGSTSSEKWQARLIHALLWWKKQYEENLKHLRGAVLDWQKSTLTEENRKGEGDDLTLVLILYHLGNINIYITMPELGVAAGASKILGRPASPFEKRMLGDKIARWAGTPGAIHALYHALELVKYILFPKSASNFDPADDVPLYEASSDNIPNRPWALYFATMVIWAYGYHQDGPLNPYPHHLEYAPDGVPSSTSSNTYQRRERFSALSSAMFGDRGELQALAPPPHVKSARIQDIKVFLEYMCPSSVASPQDLSRHLQETANGKNRVVGLLSVVDEALAGSSWELLDEARQRLKSAASILRTGTKI
jgi:hypothetical protein